MFQILPDSLLLVGKVIRPHGLGGLLRIWSYARNNTSFLDTGTVFLKLISGETRKYTVTSIRPHKNVFLMELEGLTSGDEADKLRDAEIFVRKESLSCEEGEHFWYELLDLKVYLDTGEYLGSISQIISSGGNDIYVVKEEKKEIFIPATYEVVKQIDLKNGKMIISAIEGLLDLNEV